jgi:antitoxin (DNA-binding transcriptional repressor) of toxin-antitoxin stability system
MTRKPDTLHMVREHDLPQQVGVVLDGPMPGRYVYGKTSAQRKRAMTPKSVDVTKIGKRLPKLVEQVEHGTPVYLTRDRHRVAEIVPLKPRILGLHKGQVTCSDDFDAELPAGYWTGD